VLSWSFMNDITSTPQCARSSVVLNTSRINEIEDLHNLFSVHLSGSKSTESWALSFTYFSRRSFGGLGSKLDAINTPLTGVSLQYLVTRHSHSWRSFLALATRLVGAVDFSLRGYLASLAYRSWVRRRQNINTCISFFFQTTCR
jgi:hypothetical protein